MKHFRERYRELLHMYFTMDREQALYQANLFIKDFVSLDLPQEALVNAHFSLLEELGRTSSTSLSSDVALPFLLEVMISYGINCGRGVFSSDNLNNMQKMVFQLSSSLTQFENRHLLILNAIPTGVISISPNGILTFMNKRFEEIFEVQAENILGKNIFETWEGTPFSGFFATLVKDTLERCEANMDVEMPYQDGKIMRISTSPVFNSNNQIEEVITSVWDITASKLLEQSLERHTKMAALGNLAAGIAHELRNPLTTIRGFIQLLQADFVDSPKQIYCDIVLDEIDRANNVLKDFLSFSKPVSLQRKWILMGALLEEIYHLMESEAIVRKIRLELVISQPLPGIYIDKDSMKQVLLNIIQNAFDAVGENGLVTLSGKSDTVAGMVYILVTDNGMGIPANLLPRIFDPFVTSKETGTGLGLAISYRIIQNHGGDILVNSTPSSGSVFTIQLPLECVPKDV